MKLSKLAIAIGGIASALLITALLKNEIAQPTEGISGTEHSLQPAEIAQEHVATPKNAASPKTETTVEQPTERVEPHTHTWPTSIVEAIEIAHPDQIAAIRHIVRSVEFETYASLSEADADNLLKYAHALQSAAPQQITNLCWAPSTSPHVQAAFEGVRALAISDGESDPLIPQAIFQADVRWTSTATDGSTGNEGTPITLTWSFVPDGTMINNNNGQTLASDLIAQLNTTYGAPTTANDYTTAAWFPLFEDAFASWAAETGNRYIYEPADDGDTFPILGSSSGASGSIGIRGDVRIAGVSIDGNSNTLAFNYYPNSGDMVIDTADTSNFTNNSTTKARFLNTIAHEHGHGLGLGHVCPTNQTKLMEPSVTTNFSGVQFDDSLTSQALYGDGFERNGANKNNNTIATAHDLGALNATGTAQNVTIGNSNDIDIYRFQISSARQLNITVTPTAQAAYTEGAQNGSNCSAGTLFDPTDRQNLSIRVIDTDGTTVMGSSDTSAIGQIETLSNIQLLQTGQDYYVEVTGGGENSGDANNAQLYALDLELVDPSAVQLSNFTITQESCEPNNGVADPGETITASIDISNIGTEAASNIDVTLSGTANLSIIGSATQNIASLTAGSSTSLSYTFILSGECQATETIQFRADTSTGFVELNPELTLGTIGVVSIENFDSTTVGQVPTGYTQSSDNSAADWQTVASNIGSSPNAVATQNANFSENSAVLISPTLNEVAESTTIEFDHRYNLNNNINAGVFEISINNGPWVDWITAGGTFEQNGYDGVTYTTVTINDVPYVNPVGANRDAWTGDLGSTVTTIAKFPPLSVGQSTRVRWFMGSLYSNTGSHSGWFIDNITLRGPVCCETIIPTISVTAPSPTVEELTPSTTADFVVTADMDVSSNLTVAYTLSGDATSTSDFVALAGTATIDSGQDSVSIPVTAITDSEIEGDETLTLTLSPSVNYGIDTATASITIKDLPFDEFRSDNFGAATTNIADAADFDFDGIQNLVEYAFRLDPTNSDTLPFSLVVQGSEGATLDLTYYEDTELSDVGYIVETSTTLTPESWTIVGVTITAGSTTNGLQTKTASVDIDDQPRFIRIRIERTAP
ncbi:MULTISPECIES: matrixin family metalloprotease [unclassified Lentimonas]|uniref:matrixin family metalloprotease n=1 Tax=unclassified Lentimonas TaxID=2630993 RepID=UPI00132C6CAB|nr:MULTISPECIES: matrixin family metalloprotease [unclassified Lentimonas]CAA6680100.1 Unannotated [Lentimonas sp. CC4]CAA6685080.1 Unannotated [Lentimonas sp. CC6]CAA6691444.1 Unannotated [Lentimonas sp. CC10]CAA6693181.1 Unannotated [Lentimonas sp. CC19]CAA7068937.1 Unannotated [Lentimonas sp. CC11]